MSATGSAAGERSSTPCSFFAQGKCRNGANCKFFHAEREDLAVRPVPCKFFLQNACSAGRGCKFSHDPSLLRSLRQPSGSTREVRALPGSYGVACKFFKSGECSAGDRCPYVHVEQDKKPSPRHKMLVLSSKKPETSSEDKEVKAVAPTDVAAAPASPKEVVAEVAAPGEDSDRDVTELSEFISKEEELYYYGAPGEFAEDELVAPPPIDRPSYRDIAGKNSRQVFPDAAPAPPKICTFFLQGLCRYGDSCFYSHALNERVETEDEMVAIGEEIRLSQEVECAICYENVMAKNERFGLLSGCNHAFCLSCVRNWRGHADQPKQTMRQCPVCRIETHFIIPSSRMVTDPVRKKALIDEYRRNLSAIPCRHFNEGKGSCPFGTSCFYAHRLADGSEASRDVRTAVDSEGQYDVLRQIRLEHYFQQEPPTEPSS